WTSWRGRAIEPVVRESMRRLPGDQLPAGTNAIGGYWTRTNNPEVDIVGADREPVVRKAADMAEDKIEELEARGSLSPKAAAVTSGAVRVANVGASVAAAAVSSAAGSAIKGDESVRLVDAVRGAARNPAATARTYLENTATGLGKAELGAQLAVQGHVANAKYLMRDENV
ncbi:MAG: hypothetical protein ACRDTH_26400, partial [Pseudonocardiaceae bacterium]